MFPVLEISIFVLGAIVASFMGVVADRLNTGQSFVRGRSHCDVCGVELPPKALVPIFSYVLLQGRASCCGVKLSIASPLIELGMGLLFLLSYGVFGLSLEVVVFLMAISLLYALVRYDLSHQILPTELLWPFVLTAFVALSLRSHNVHEFLYGLVPGALVAGILALMHFGSKGRAMGLADAPLVFGLGLLVYPAVIPGFIFSFWIGGALGIIVLARRPRGSRMGIEVPFAPFLAAGFLLAFFTQWNPLAYIAFSPIVSVLLGLP